MLNIINILMYLAFNEVNSRGTFSLGLQYDLVGRVWRFYGGSIDCLYSCNVFVIYYEERLK